jgi:ribonuclease HI
MTRANSVPAESSSPVEPSSRTEERAKIFAALADATRLKIVELLAAQGELSGTDIANQVGISLALFCHHSRTLAEAGVIHFRKDGQSKLSSLNQRLLSDCFASFTFQDKAGLAQHPNDPPPAPLSLSTTPGAIRAIYTDGACSGNPGAGGWGTVIYFADGGVQELGGYAPHTTNNRMELKAAIAALEFLATVSPSQPIPLYTDSQYVQKGITQWLRGWKRKGWKKANGEDVTNQDLWQQMDQLNLPHVRWTYVKGHAGDVGNERADAIARAFALGKTPSLHQASKPPA